MSCELFFIVSPWLILCSLCTLSGSGSDIISEVKGIEFATVIIDEACQAVELSTLVPLRYGCRRCILVGDPQQLPPTVISNVAAKYLYDQSLFQRLQRCAPESVSMLRCLLFLF
jgi:senataxin